MRILLVTPMVPRADGAGAIPILLYAELVALAERHQVTLVTAAGDEPGEVAAAASLAEEGFDVRVADRRRPPPGIKRWRRRWRLAATWARGRWPWRTVWFADPAVQTLIDEVVAARRYDLAAVEDSAMSVFRIPEGMPTVLTEHEVRRPRRIAWRSRSPRSAFHELDWRRWKRFQLKSWQRFDRLQVYSERDAVAVASLAPELADRVRVNPFGVVLGPQPHASREVAGTVLFAGNFAHQPNRDAAVWLAREIMPALRRRCPQARLRLVGTAPPPEVRDLSGPAVELVADAPSIEPHLAAASIVVAPLRTGGGMRMKVLQAMAAAKPVVTTARGAEGFTALDPDPPLVVAERTEEIAAAAAQLLEDGGRRRKLAGQGREFAERHHSTAAWGARLQWVYDELVAGERGNG